tara:strand:+ start:261 stop:368 length:108 start_codon:yes stop_codon:yes gene_type:complete
MDRKEYYELASKMFERLDALSKSNGGPAITKPCWL